MGKSKPIFERQLGPGHASWETFLDAKPRYTHESNTKYSFLLVSSLCLKPKSLFSDLVQPVQVILRKRKLCSVRPHSGVPPCFSLMGRVGLNYDGVSESQCLCETQLSAEANSAVQIEANGK